MKGEIYERSEENSSDSDEMMTETIEEELQKFKDIQMNKITYNTSDVRCFDAIQDKILDTNVKTNEHLNLNSNQEELKNHQELNNHSSELKQDISKATNAKKTGRVSFIEPYVIKDAESEEEILIPNEKSCFISKQDKTHDDSENEDDIVRIEFSHSSYIPNISASNNTEIQSPTDIYKMFSAPKSILKRSPNDMIPNQIAPLLNEESTDAEEDEVEHVKDSIYNSVSRNNLMILIHWK